MRTDLIQKKYIEIYTESNQVIFEKNFVINFVQFFNIIKHKIFVFICFKVKLAQTKQNYFSVYRMTKIMQSGQFYSENIQST